SPEALALGIGHQSTTVGANTNTDNTFVPNYYAYFAAGTLTYIDTLDCACFDLPTTTPGEIFCSDIGAPPSYNYDLAEDVDTTGHGAIGGALGGDTYIFHS